MAALQYLLLCLLVLSAAMLPPASAREKTRPGASAGLRPNFYHKTCPQALPTIRRIVEKAVDREARMGASLLRLHFHDCFVNGCDASVLLDDTPNFTGEKTATQNRNSLRGLEVIDEIKAELNRLCGNVVSCADILAVAARDSVSLLGGMDFRVFLGRKDARSASFDRAQKDIPSIFSDISKLTADFENQGLDIQDLVVLSGAHTIGLARCPTFRNRIYNDTNIDQKFAAGKRQICPPSGGITHTAELDSTTKEFDTAYYRDLQQFRGLLHTDQELFKGDGGFTDRLVKTYASDPRRFKEDFGTSMIKMGNIKVLTGNKGEVRLNCRSVN